MMQRLRFMHDPKEMGEWIFLGNIIDMGYPDFHKCLRHFEKLGVVPNGWRNTE